MNELDNQLHSRKIRMFIFDCIVFGLIAYALYTYVWPILKVYL
jgi:hypothetical protein